MNGRCILFQRSFFASALGIFTANKLMSFVDSPVRMIFQSWDNSEYNHTSHAFVFIVQMKIPSFKIIIDRGENDQ